MLNCEIIVSTRSTIARFKVDPRVSITVSRSKSFGQDEFQAAQINWPALGDQTAEEAEAFSEALSVAVRYAKMVDKIDDPIKSIVEGSAVLTLLMDSAQIAWRPDSFEVIRGVAKTFGKARHTATGRWHTLLGFNEIDGTFLLLSTRQWVQWYELDSFCEK